jgi:hypothetical protein
MGEPEPPIFGEMALPPGAVCGDPRWQKGYEEGGEMDPTSADPVYVSGWCHGYCEWHQSTDVEAVMEYRSRPKPTDAPSSETGSTETAG